jgi:hypothetical protein
LKKSALNNNDKKAFQTIIKIGIFLIIP